ncbi:hypothetical protein RND81_14G057900 [Saponaria officinalis]|uniref:Uncharacterized protein n=1 Tax=Saponaria officinalis TaxID=3572 RepID=A0AAW1GNS7_SAPOF
MVSRFDGIYYVLLIMPNESILIINSTNGYFGNLRHFLIYQKFSQFSRIPISIFKPVCDSRLCHISLWRPKMKSRRLECPAITPEFDGLPITNKPPAYPLLSTHRASGCLPTGGSSSLHFHTINSDSSL